MLARLTFLAASFSSFGAPVMLFSARASISRFTAKASIGRCSWVQPLMTRRFRLTSFGFFSDIVIRSWIASSRLPERFSW